MTLRGRDGPTSAYIDVTWDGDIATISAQRGIDGHLGLRFRVEEVGRRIESRLKRVGPTERDTEGHRFMVSCPSPRVAALSKVLGHLDAALDLIATRPLTPRLVQQALEITSRERLRWTKDGRLPQQGSATIRRGQLINISTYAVSQIADLMAHPRVIEGWRCSDAAERTKRGDVT